MFNDKQVFDDGQFYPRVRITVVQVSSSIEALKILVANACVWKARLCLLPRVIHLAHSSASHLM